MALSTPFSLTDVRGEYGPNSRPASDDLSTYHLDIFGTNGAGDDLQDFDGYGAPLITSDTATADDEDSFTVNFNISRGSLSCYVQLQWYEDDGQVPFSGQSYSSTTFQQVTTDSASISTPDNLSSSTTYQYRLVYYNAFNDATADHEETTPDTVTTDAPASLSIPVISGPGNTREYNGADGYLEFTYSDSEDDFDVEIRIDGSTVNSETRDCDLNVGTSTTTKKIRFSWSTLPNSSIEFRVRATSTSLTDSGWSSWNFANSVSLFQLPSCPLS